MSIDGPDYSRAIVASQILLASTDPGTTTVDIQLDATITALWLYNAQFDDSPPPEVVGVGTGTRYPVYTTPIGVTNNGSVGPWIALVNPILDPEVTVTAPGTADLDWYVIGDTSMRVVASLPLQLYPPT